MAAAYFSVFLATVALCLRELVYNTANSEFSALAEIAVTLPWSFMSIRLCDALGVIKWHDSLAVSPLVYGLTGALIFLPGAIINAGVCYLVGMKLQKA